MGDEGRPAKAIITSNTSIGKVMTYLPLNRIQFSLRKSPERNWILVSLYDIHGDFLLNVYLKWCGPDERIDDWKDWLGEAEGDLGLLLRPRR